MRKSRLSKVKQQKLLEHFVAASAPRCAAEIEIDEAQFHKKLEYLIAIKRAEIC